MAQLRRAKSNDQHLFIMAGRSKGIKQIRETGKAWLETQGYFLPSPGGWVKLNQGDYQYLEKQDALYIKGEDYTKSSAQGLNIALLPTEAVRYGSPLLLQLADNHHIVNHADVEWKLVLKLDKWEEGARDALLGNHAAAVGCYVASETGIFTFSNISLQQILNPDYWPEVAPQRDNYTLYWQNSKLYQEDSPSTSGYLSEATSPAGLKVGWQGTVFFRLNSDGLMNTWKRYLPHMSISARNAREFYWLAQSNLEPEPLWPGKALRIGQAKQGWQLWHLHAEQENDQENVATWLGYRQIHLNYSSWQLSLLNPLSVVADYKYTCLPNQQLLVCCNPPTQQAEDGQAGAFVSLTPYTKSVPPQHQPSGSIAQSQRLVSDPENTESYLRAPAPPANQEYRISMGEQAIGRSFRVQTTPLSTQLPAWLHGLRCSLITAGKRHILKAFSDAPIAKPYFNQLSIHENFALEQLEQATWSYQPSSIPCSLSWEYFSPQGERCQGKNISILTDSALTTQWQTYIWPQVAKSSWVRLTLDAASFGTINLRLILKSEPLPEQALKSETVLPPISAQKPTNDAESSGIQGSERSFVNIAQQAWWTNSHYTANFFWLCKMVREETAQMQQEIPLELSQTLERLCDPDMPATLKNTLMLLAMSRSMPVWIYLRLQALLTDLYSTSELVVEESWE